MTADKIVTVCWTH